MATLHEQRSVNNRQIETAFGEAMHGGTGRPPHGRRVDLREPVGEKNRNLSWLCHCMTWWLGRKLSTWEFSVATSRALGRVDRDFCALVLAQSLLGVQNFQDGTWWQLRSEPSAPSVNKAGTSETVAAEARFSLGLFSLGEAGIVGSPPRELFRGEVEASHHGGSSGHHGNST